ncbi:MAG: hypothetical protein Q8P18_18000 [Pseudomonadota bacterium]|nr:hypothetical protein [Pseudomonadota bacterium]
MLLVGYSAVLGLLVLGVVDLLAWSRAREADRLKRARLAGAAAWLFGVGASALTLATGFSAVTGASPEQEALLVAEVVQDSVGPAALGMIGGMIVAGLATFLERRQGP